VLRSKYGIEVTGHTPRDVRWVGLSSFDLIIAMDQEIQLRLLDEHGLSCEVWGIEDPGADACRAVYSACSDQVEAKVRALGRQLGLGLINEGRS
jgi:protein-tyrosine-phosphatase